MQKNLLTMQNFGLLCSILGILTHAFLACQDPSHWDLVDPLPSYGRGIELPGKRYRSLINGDMLTDVVVTGKSTCIFICFSFNNRLFGLDCCLPDIYLLV
jgi:hypothetical protein